MTGEARRGWCGLVMAAGFFAGGCAWEVAPASKSTEALDTASDASVGDGGLRAERLTRTETPCDPTSSAKLVGPFACGETFATTLWGECNDCEDRGCTMAEEDFADCTCFGVVEFCVSDPLNDAGDYVDCFEHGGLCDCGDGKGRVYECDCEGGVSSPNECGCRLPRDDTFDYEFMCEQ
jgi:hypothetical protein